MSAENYTEKITKVYNNACKLKDEAIKYQEIEFYIKASEKFQEVINLADKLKKDKSLSEQSRLELMINQLYYDFEKENCLTVVFYEKHNIGKAKEHHNKGISSLRNSIKLAQKSLDSFKGEDKKRIENNLIFNRFLLSNSEAFKSSIIARDYWDKGDYIRALDYYRKSLIQNYETLEHFSEENLDPRITRIVTGNFYGMMINVSNALAGIVLKKINTSYEEIPLNLLVKLFQCGIESYNKSNEAFSINPESEQFLEIAQQSMINMTETLKELPIDIWRKLYLEFYDNDDFLKIMRKTNLVKFGKIEKEFDYIYGSNFIIIVNIVLWLSFVIFPLFAFKFFNLIWWQIFLFLMLFFIVLIVINIVFLRLKNKLSEENFIKLIKIALKYSFKLLDFVFKKFSK